MPSLLLFILLAADAGAAPDALADPGAIERACKAACNYTAKHFAAGLIVADVSEEVLPKTGQGAWKIFKTSKEMEGAGAEGAPNTQARVWVAPGGVTYVDMFFQSDSGDWAHFVDYCYRSDGTLARTESTYNTFLSEDQDGVSRVRKRDYDATGKVLRSKQRVLNLQTKKPAPKARFPDEPEPLFPKLEELPFWNVVREALPRR